VNIERQVLDQVNRNTSMGSSIVQYVKYGLPKKATDVHAVIPN